MKPITRVAMLGSGVMGTGIAALLAGAGIEVYLLNRVPSELTDEERLKGLTLNSKEVKNRSSQKSKDRAMNARNKIIFSKESGDLIKVGNFTDDLHIIGTCDWIIEGVVENLEVKKALMEKIFEFWKPGIIVSTNTSGVEISKIVEDMPEKFKSHFLGTHFFNPVRFMKLFELIPLKNTLPEVIETIANLVDRRLGKGIVYAKDTPCFVANRIGTYANVVVFDAMKKYNISIKDTDTLTGTVIGRPRSATFRLLDMVGLDTFVNIMNNLQIQIYDEEEKSKFKVPDYIQTLYDNKFFGDKVGQGFYKKVKTSEGRSTQVFDLEKQGYCEVVEKVFPIVEKLNKQKNLEDKLRTLVYSDGIDSKFAWEVIKNTLLYAAEKVPEIADDYKSIDDGMVWGYNWEKGPFQIWDSIGLIKSVERMQNEGNIVPAWVLDRIKAGKESFYEIKKDYCEMKSNIIIKSDEAVLTDIGDGVACFTFRTKSNVLTKQLIDFMDRAIDEVENNYIGMVIQNEGKNFSAGFDLQDIAILIENKKWDIIENQSKCLQSVLMKAKYSKRYIVSAPFGMVLGGGTELVMHTHAAATFIETYMGLVEVAVGLVPSGGGVKEYLVRAMENIKGFNYAQVYPNIREAWYSISTCAVTGSALEAFNRNLLNKNTRIVMNRDYMAEEAKKLILQMAEDGVQRPIRKEIKIVGEKGKAAILNEIGFMKDGNFISEHDALIAQKVASIITGGSLPSGTSVSEEHILELEREAFLSLCGEKKTKERIEYMLRVGKPLRN